MLLAAGPLTTHSPTRLTAIRRAVGEEMVGAAHGEVPRDLRPQEEPEPSNHTREEGTSHCYTPPGLGTDSARSGLGTWTQP